MRPFRPGQFRLPRVIFELEAIIIIAYFYGYFRSQSP